MTSASTLEHALLDLLVDASSSFAAIYRAANRFLRSGRVEQFAVEEIWDCLARMEASGWVKARLMLPVGAWKEPTGAERETAQLRYQAWLPGAAYDELSVDEVGLWFDLQPLGRSEWNTWSETADEPPKWMFDQDSDSSMITVRAATVDGVEQVLDEWLRQHPDIDIVRETRAVEPSGSFRLRDGTTVEAGVCLRVTYRQRRSQSDPASS